MKSLSKSMVALIVVAVVVIGFVGYGVSKYNGFVGQEETVTTAWGNLQAQYQRRADLIPNLVNTVKGYAQHENETFTQVIEARAKATQMNVSADDLTPEKLQQIQQAQGELSSALGRLLLIQERYPELKANEQFLELQAQLEGTENRITEYRNKYNEAVQTYNVGIRQFPANIVAGICGFEKKSKFEATAEAQNAPKVEF